MTTPNEALQTAVKAIGGYAETARRLGLKTAWAVQKWPKCPAERVKGLVAASNGAVSAHELRPDLYPNGFQFPSEVTGACET
jgi:DNA-binding transcriptional regulator YdaS (Cro superfamily)